ncbi:cyclic nucleotide-binding domain-containing protein [Magnetovibrio sp. PR-2]|uniref:cyclic nucleotide-binding domain-containing protein n=1 Tax=Magnetovibrio sp. PR-2 TaxID=3120356 RepID=UPI002FCDF711
MAQLINGKAKVIKQRDSFTKLATIKVPAMRDMSNALKRELQKRMTCRLIMSGSTIRMGGGRRDDIFFLVSGQAVGIQNHLDSTTITPLECGDGFVDRAVGLGAEHVKSVIANSNCVVCSLPADVYKQALVKNKGATTGNALGLMDLLSLMFDTVFDGTAQTRQKRA